MKKPASVMLLVWGASLALVLIARPSAAGTLTVTTIHDSGAGSLRQAVWDAVPGDTIVFNVSLPATITLSSGPLLLDKALSIEGPGAGQLTLSGDGERVISITHASVFVSDLAIAGGYTLGDGGGAWIASDATLRLDGVALRDNWATGGYGGGIYNQGVLSVTRSTFYGNVAVIGGGGLYNLGTAALDGVMLDGNLSAIGAGFSGGIANAGEGNLVMANSTLKNSRSAWDAGLSNGGDASTTILNSTISANTATAEHGGIGNYGDMTLVNCTVSGNSAGSDGGGIYNTGSLTLTNVTLAYNQTEHGGGGGLHVSGGAATLQNTLLAANSGSAPDCSGTLNSQGHNLIGNLAGCTLAGAGGGDLTGAAPGLGQLQDNGGQTWTLALAPCSAAVDMGKPLSCPSTDQRGMPRQGPCDIGAYELAPLTIRGSAPGAVEAGELITYSFTISNGSRLSLANVIATNTVPAGSLYAGGGTHTGDAVRWTLTTLTPCTSVQVSFAVTPAAGLKLVVNAGYRASADGNYSAAGARLATLVDPLRVYLPAVFLRHSLQEAGASRP